MTDEEIVERPSGAVFAPTRMKDWVRCPRYAKLRREVEPISDWTPNMLLGRSLDAGLVLVYREVMAGQPLNADLHTRGLEMALVTLQEGYQDNETWPIEGLEKMVSRVYAESFKDDLLAAGSLISVDTSLGVGRPDFVQRSRDGKSLIVTDRKFTLKLEAHYLAKTLAEYEVDDQFWHYAWEAEQMWGLPVTWLRVHLLIGTPKPKSILHPWPVTRDRLYGLWLPSAEQTWKDMQEEREGKRPVVGKWANCMGKFGRCPFHTFCHENPAQRALYYRPVEPK